jgi:Kef-type K+ transport system membrane component KefB
MRTMLWVLLVAAALVVSHHFTAGAPLAARATLALGGVVLAAEIGGRLALRLGLPRVTGYLTAGLLMSPGWLTFVRTDEAQALAFVSDAAIAVFALRAGLAWRGAEGNDSGSAGLGRYLTASIVTPLVLTAAVVFALHSWFPLSVHQPLGDAAAVALAVGALTVVAAPALAWATLYDAPRAGLSDALLRLHALRDTAAIAVFAVVLALSRFAASAGTLRADAWWTGLLPLAGSVVSAALLVWLVSRTRRLVGGTPGMYALAVAVGAAVAGLSGQVEVTLAALLAGIGLTYADPETAGMVRRHFDARGELLAAGAFALLGVRLDVSSVADLWPWMLLLIGLRGLGLYWGGRWAGRRLLVSEDLAKSGWLGLISQGSLGLLIAATGRRAFPEWGVSFEGLAVGLVALHAVVGPVCMRQALARRPALTEGASRDS